MKEFLDSVEVILVLAVVFYLTWVSTRFIAKRSQTKSEGRFLKVVDRLNISGDKSILLIKAGAEYCVVGMTAHGMSLIRTLDAEEKAAWDAMAAAAAQNQNPTMAESLATGAKAFAERLGFAVKARPTRPPQAFDPATKIEDDDSVIDMMNERVKLRKDSKWR